MHDDFDFSINVKSNNKDWIGVRDNLLQKFGPFAVYFHGRIKSLV